MLFWAAYCCSIAGTTMRPCTTVALPRRLGSTLAAQEVIIALLGARDGRIMDRDGLRTLKVQASHIYPGLTVAYVNLLLLPHFDRIN